MGKYADDPTWASLTPLPLDEGGTAPLAAIAYSADYAETMAYLRAAMAAHELSTRVLALTEDLIALNPAHYTVWLYRVKCLEALGADWAAELRWLDGVALQHLKNYQIWHHRMVVVGHLGRLREEGVGQGVQWAEAGGVQGETAFVERMLEKDAKNYHVWSYRQWLVRRFGLYGEEELEFTEKMVREDVRNNSAWNHRWFVVNWRAQQADGAGREEGVAGSEVVRRREVAFAKTAIALAPQNASAWNYLRAILKTAGLTLASERAFAEGYASVDGSEVVVQASFALEFVADALAEQGERERANRAWEALKRCDPVRERYWESRKVEVGVEA